MSTCEHCGADHPAALELCPTTGKRRAGAADSCHLEPMTLTGVDAEELIDPAAPAAAGPSPEPSPRRPVAGDFEAPAEAALELDETPPERSPESPADPETLAYRPAGRGTGAWRWAAGLLVAAGLGALLWHHRAEIRAAVTGRPAEPATILLLIETEPRGAEVLVDGVVAVSQPVQLPCTRRLHTVRVRAAGYQAEEIEVSGERTRAVRVRLRRHRAR